MAMKIGSVRSVKTRRAQDRMVKTGQKRDQNGCKRDRVGPIQTHGEGHRFVHMLPLACNDVALAFFQFCSVPDIYIYIYIYIYMPFILFVLSSGVRALLRMPTLSSLYCGILTKLEASWKGIGSQKSR